MYETEANIRVEPSHQISPDVLSGFGALRGKIVKRTVLPWSEHCTECVWPSCYTTCDLYSPREDGRCRRFIDGMVRLECPAAINKYVLKIRFKQWGKLWTPGNLRLHPIDEAEKIEKRDYRLGTVLYQLPLPAPIKKKVTSKRYNLKKKAACKVQTGNLQNGDLPTCFLVECFNPTDRAINLSLTIRSFQNEDLIPFQKLICVPPGLQVERIPVEEISKVINLSAPFQIELIPNDIGEELTLYFGLMDFVHEQQSSQIETKPEERTSPKSTKKIKCVVWDLDNTLWNGILVEDGPENLKLKEGIPEIIEALDRRGILQSIASKNNHDEAMQVLKRFQIDEFFLYPKISWDPKGGAIHEIARDLNISADSILFVDDSEFELQQVQAVCPGVMVLDAMNYVSLPEMEECQVPVTSESVNRRKMYQVERARQETAQVFQNDYKAFLKHCDIQLTIRPLSVENLERVHELTQRTNQMNFSGNRYDRDVLKGILQTPYLDTYVLACQDRFGSYGIVGFGIVDSREPRLTDLMFSCRIQSKRVEHAFLGYLLRKYIEMTARDFYANYRQTSRNAPAGKVFTDVGMREVENRDGVLSLVFAKEMQVPDEGLINIVAQETSVGS